MPVPPPKISFSFILNRDVVLVSHQTNATDYSSVIKSLKEFTQEIPISEESQKLTFDNGDSEATHTIIKGGNVFGCIAPVAVPAYVCFSFLSKVCDEMSKQTSLISRSHHASENEFDRDFRPVISQLMESCAEGVVSDKLVTVQKQVQDVKEILLKNVEMMVERGERLDDLLNKTESLEAQGSQFRQSTRELYIHVWWKNFKYWIIIGGVITIILVSVILYCTDVFKKK